MNGLFEYILAPLHLAFSLRWLAVFSPTRVCLHLSSRCSTKFRIEPYLVVPFDLCCHYLLFPRSIPFSFGIGFPPFVICWADSTQNEETEGEERRNLKGRIIPTDLLFWLLLLKGSLEKVQIQINNLHIIFYFYKIRNNRSWSRRLCNKLSAETNRMKDYSSLAHATLFQSNINLYKLILYYKSELTGGPQAFSPTFLIASATPSTVSISPLHCMSPTLSVCWFPSLISKYTDRCSGGGSISDQESRGKGSRVASSPLI